MHDVIRAGAEIAGIETKHTAQLKQLMMSCMRDFQELGLTCLTEVYAHSEGTAITRQAIRSMPEEYQECIKDTFILNGIAGAAPFQRGLGKAAYNAYSKRDGITEPLARKYRTNPNYDIEYLELLTPRRERIWGMFDHGWQDRTLSRWLNFRKGIDEEVYGISKTVR